MAAAFTATPRAGAAPLTVAFTDESTGTIESYDWDFGDGSAHSTEENPTHEYTSPGVYTVVLTVEDYDEGPLTAQETIEAGPVYNCSCDDESDNETLSALRRRLLIRLGYAAQAENPPPGMASLLNEFLIGAQRFLYNRPAYRALRVERFFSWTMAPGVRMYDLPDNDETCSKVLNPYKLSWVGVEDLNGVWYQLTSGIPPEFYTSVVFQGIPSRYEIRQCIEVFPAPAAAYKLRIKGQFGLTAFAADDDKTTIDSELVFLWALANAKAHYGQGDAEAVAAQANTYLGGLIAGTHGTKRYVPGTTPADPWTPPRFLPLDS